MQSEPAKSQVPSHQAEFMMSTDDYPKLLGELDNTAASFHLNRFGAAPGLNELKGREVLYADYKSNIDEWRAALDLTDVKLAGKVLVSVYIDYFDDSEQGTKFVAEVTRIIHRYGGTLKQHSD